MGVSTIMSSTGLVYDLGIVMIIVTILGLFAHLLRQPLIPVYIFTGVILNLLSEKMGVISPEYLNSFSELGIAFLLFLVGMELDVDKLRSIGKISVIGTLLQVVITAFIGFLFSIVFGMNFKTSLLLGVIVAFSSTALVIKYLSDNEKIDSLEGRISIGMLIMQDILVVMFIPFVTSSYISYQNVFLVIIKAIGFLTLTLLLNRYLIKSFMARIYKNPEIAFIFSLSILFLFSILSTLLGFSVAIGGFLAGLSMAVYPYSSVIISRITHLRDFFLILFFVSLGLNIHLTHGLYNYLPLLLILSIVTIFIKPIIISLILYFFNIDVRTSVSVGLSLNQVSEFSLILSILSLNSGNINKELVSLVALLLFLTSVSSSYFLKWNSKLSKIISKKFSNFDHFYNLNYSIRSNIKRDHILIMGINTCSRLLMENLHSRYPIIMVDYDPLKVQLIKKMGYNSYYGDVLDESTLKEMNIAKSKLVVCCISDLDTTHHLVGIIKGINKFVKVVVKAKNFDDALKLYDEGADYVIIDGLHGIDDIISVVKSVYNNEENLRRLRKKEITFLTKEKEKEILAMHLPLELLNLKKEVENNDRKNNEGNN